MLLYDDQYLGTTIAAGRTKDLKRATSEAVRKMVCRTEAHSRLPVKSKIKKISKKKKKNFLDERCTVYVGRIETTTSKDELKKKFEKYGAIKEISTHQKKNG